MPPRFHPSHIPHISVPCRLQLDAEKATVLDVLIHDLRGHSLEVQTHGTLVKVAQQRLTVAHEEVELVCGQLPQDQRTDVHLVGAAFQDHLVGQAAWEGAQHELAEENVLHSSLRGVVLPVQVP